MHKTASLQPLRPKLGVGSAAFVLVSEDATCNRFCTTAVGYKEASTSLLFLWTPHTAILLSELWVLIPGIRSLANLWSEPCRTRS